jgi:hypothetical protein
MPGEVAGEARFSGLFSAIREKRGAQPAVGFVLSGWFGYCGGRAAGRV